MDGYSNFKRVNHSKFSPIHWIQMHKNHLYQDPRAGKSVESQALCFEKNFQMTEICMFFHQLTFTHFDRNYCQKGQFSRLPENFLYILRLSERKTFFQACQRGFRQSFFWEKKLSMGAKFMKFFSWGPLFAKIKISRNVHVTLIFEKGSINFTD